MEKKCISPKRVPCLCPFTPRSLSPPPTLSIFSKENQLKGLKESERFNDATCQKLPPPKSASPLHDDIILCSNTAENSRTAAVAGKKCFQQQLRYFRLSEHGEMFPL
ncbi:hypothetical protein CgunFtcFv8_023875 [Champsocephalus gunnari]|uniref:Uncharacterized protein n=1 Tax=Champsocephalus gunnari TaxID=52237 RepID=A0AAN8HLL8_CHAGU|nr:hypothetical protein CgunFtcFv8_023875 [Champsocephalus gunnari]